MCSICREEFTLTEKPVLQPVVGTRRSIVLRVSSEMLTLRYPGPFGKTPSSLYMGRYFPCLNLVSRHF